MQGNGGISTFESAGRAADRGDAFRRDGRHRRRHGTGRGCGIRDIITLDMGGTSADVARWSRTGRRSLPSAARIGTHPLLVPTLDMVTIGAGGGSIAWVEGGSALRVGPHSAGSVPGPACYGQGGTRSTVTDANLVAGRLNGDYFLGGAPAPAPSAGA